MAGEHPPRDVSYELGGIKQQLETITRTLSEDRTASAQYRTDIRRELTSRGEAIASVAADLGLVKRDVSDMKPKVESLNQRSLMTDGAAKFAIVLGKFGHLITAAIGGVIAVLVERYLGGRP